MWFFYVLFYSWLFDVYKANLIAMASNLNPYYNLTFSYHDIQGQNNHVIFLDTNNNFSCKLTYKALDMNYTASQTFPYVNNPGAPFIRTSALNTDHPNAQILQFQNSYVAIRQNIGTYAAQNLSFSQFPSNFTIYDTCFGRTLGQIYVIGNFYNSIYTLVYFNNSISPSFQMNLTTIFLPNKFDKLLFIESKLIVSFQSLIVVVNSTTFLQIISISIQFTELQFMDFDIDSISNMLIYCVYQTVTIYNLTSNAVVYTTNFTEYVSSIQIGASNSEKYVYIATQSKVFQLDLDIFQIIAQEYLEYAPVPQRLIFVNGDQLINTIDRTIDGATLIKNFTITSTYSANTCYPTYALNPNTSLCQKFPPPPVSIPLNSSNASILPVELGSEDINLQQKIQEIMKVQINQSDAIYKTISTMLIVSSFKISPQFLVVFLVFFDDIWLYRFHQYIYPTSVQFFFHRVDIIEKNRLSPWFLLIVQFFNTNSGFGVSNDQKMKEYLNIDSIQEENVFFMRSGEENCRNNIFFTFGIFFFLKILYLVFASIYRMFHIFYGICVALADLSRLQPAFETIVDSNIAKISFNFGLQLILPSCGQFYDKLNLIVCYCAFLLVLLYCFSYYPTIYNTIGKPRAQKMIVPLVKNFKSFFLQPVIAIVRTMLRSFIHSHFLISYQIQIFLLFSTDLFFLIFIISIRKMFIKKSILVFNVSYNFIFCLFDLYFYLESTFVPVFRSRREIFGLVCILSLISISLLIGLTYFWEFLAEFVGIFCKNWIKKTANIEVFKRKLVRKKQFLNFRQHSNQGKVPQKVQCLDQNTKSHSNKIEKKLMKPQSQNKTTKKIKNNCISVIAKISNKKQAKWMHFGFFNSLKMEGFKSFKTVQRAECQQNFG